MLHKTSIRLHIDVLQVSPLLQITPFEGTVRINLIIHTEIISGIFLEVVLSKNFARNAKTFAKRLIFVFNLTTPI